MKLALYTDKSRIVDILCHAFDQNLSVNFITKQDRNRIHRIKILMEYAFEMCYSFGEVYFNDDHDACALIFYPQLRRSNFKTFFWDMKLALMCIGIFRIKKVLQRERLIKKEHPHNRLYMHLWFLGVKPEVQHQGKGSAFIQQIIAKSIQEQKDIYLETSTLTNIPWYQRNGFNIIQEIDLGYKLYIFKRNF
jgi:ribosomal protein S18 acetylase RimI-like enzyme